MGTDTALLQANMTAGMCTAMGPEEGPHPLFPAPHDMLHSHPATASTTGLDMHMWHALGCGKQAV
jgi:hypothetical protein